MATDSRAAAVEILSRFLQHVRHPLIVDATGHDAAVLVRFGFEVEACRERGAPPANSDRLRWHDECVHDFLRGDAVRWPADAVVLDATGAPPPADGRRADVDHAGVPLRKLVKGIALAGRSTVVQCRVPDDYDVQRFVDALDVPEVPLDAVLVSGARDCLVLTVRFRDARLQPLDFAAIKAIDNCESHDLYAPRLTRVRSVGGAVVE